MTEILVNVCRNIKRKEKKQQELARMWSKVDTWTLCVEMHISAATVESSMEIPQKIKNGTAL